MDIQRYDRLKRRVEQLEREQAKAEGMLEQVMSQLEEKYGCKTIRQAEKLAIKLAEEAEQVEDEYHEALEKFETQWAQLLKEPV
jgi:hypothetical protein